VISETRAVGQTAMFVAANDRAIGRVTQHLRAAADRERSNRGTPVAASRRVSANVNPDAVGAARRVVAAAERRALLQSALGKP
jgi:hypothetical protein